MRGHGWTVLLLLPVLAFAGCDGGGGRERRAPTMTAARAIELHADSLMAIPGVAGVYEGRTDQGETVLRVMLVSRSAEAERRIPRELEGYRVELEVSGKIEPMGR
jgi:hypothetical protein